MKLRFCSTCYDELDKCDHCQRTLKHGQEVICIDCEHFCSENCAKINWEYGQVIHEGEADGY